MAEMRDNILWLALWKHGVAEKNEQKNELKEEKDSAWALFWGDALQEPRSIRHY